MFDDNVTAAWQGITPPDSLKAKVLAQTVPAKVTRFPAKQLTRLASLAACLALAVVLLNPAPAANFSGVSPVARAYALQAETPLATLLLDWDGKSELTISGGELEYGEDTVLWRVFEEGEYTLTARRGLRTVTRTFSVEMTEDGLSVTQTL